MKSTLGVTIGYSTAQFAPTYYLKLGVAMINEWELECTIYSRYQYVLPDFHAQGYKLVRQVMISGISRRMDILLEKDDHAWIIELKRGSPPLQATTRQILDYERCWKAAFPSKPVSLMVISNSADDAKIMAFQSKNIAYRAVSAKEVLEALKQGIDTGLLGQCEKISVDDIDKIRFLLSNPRLIQIPESWNYLPWTHASVFYALIRDGMAHKALWFKNLYVRLFEQTTNCALLYHPEAIVSKDDDYLHLNPRASVAPEARERTIALRDQLLRRGAIVKRGHDRSGRGTSDFDCYAVTDWSALAESLGLHANL